MNPHKLAHNLIQMNMWEGCKTKRVQKGNIHIYIRGNNRNNVFYDDVDKISFLNRSNFFALKYSTIINEFVLMDNHVHIQAETDYISLFMKALLISYVRWYNNKYSTHGNLFQSPFNSVCKYSDVWKINSMLYILQNPLAAEICKHPADYKWSSYNFHFNGKSPLRKHIQVDTHLIDNHFKTRKELDTAIFERKIKNLEIDEYQHKHFDRLSNEELCEIISKITNGKSVYKLTKNEVEDLIKRVYKETNASMFQLASIMHENYEYVRKVCGVKTF